MSHFPNKSPSKGKKYVRVSPAKGQTFSSFNAVRPKSAGRPKTHMLCNQNLHNDEGRCDRPFGHPGAHANRVHRTIQRKHGNH